MGCLLLYVKTEKRKHQNHSYHIDLLTFQHNQLQYNHHRQRCYVPRCRRQLKDRQTLAFLRIHGINQKLYFADVINAMIDFVKEYDSEFLIISLKEEESSFNSTKSFEDVLENYLKDEVFDKGNSLPQKLKDARGKIYILSRMDSEYGIQTYAGWQDSTTFMLDELYIQDNYSIDDIEIKKEDIINTIEFSKTNTNYLVINFTSCYLNNAFPPTYAGTVALEINPWFNEYISNNNDSLGIIVMDFISQYLAQAIYRRNIR